MADYRDGSCFFWAGILCLLAALLLAVLLCGCGQIQKQQEKINQDLRNELENTSKQVDEQRNQIEGNHNQLTTLSQKFVDIDTKIDTKIETKIQKEQNAFQKSMNAQFESFKGTYSTKQSNSENSMWYGIGLVIVVLGFAYLVMRRFSRARQNPGSTALNFINPLSRNP